MLQYATLLIDKLKKKIAKKHETIISCPGILQGQLIPYD